ncbi:hypothetical protein LguiA_024107 [Lonicera macranthoides]
MLPWQTLVLGASSLCYKTASALAVSFAICKAATYLNKLVGIEGGDLLASTAIVVILATLLPKEFGYLAPADDTVALVLMRLLESDLKLSLLASNAKMLVALQQHVEWPLPKDGAL